MSHQPEALRLADSISRIDTLTEHQRSELLQASAELRRLHAERTAADGVINDLAAKVRGLQTQRDAMQERAEYWKRKHDDEETGAERYTLRVQRDELLAALRVFVSCAFPVSTEIDERGHRWTEAYLDQALPIARAAIKAVEEGK